MKKDNDLAKSLVKWIPVAVAVVMAAIGEISGKLEQDRIDDMDERISKLEEKKDGGA